MEGGAEKTVHAVIRVRDSRLMLADEFSEMDSDNISNDEEICAPKTVGRNSVFLNMYFENVDGIFDSAQMAGAKVIMPLEDIFWG